MKLLPPIAEWLKPLLAPAILLPLAMWAAPAIWNWLQTQVPDSVLSRGLALLFLILVSSFSYIFTLRRELEPHKRDAKIRAQFKHDPSTDISIHRRTGQRVCTRCLHITPAIAYPLHDPSGQGNWCCSANGCKTSYQDEHYKSALRQQAAKEEAERIARENTEIVKRYGRSAFS